jgi:hypothetical protein
MSFNKIVIVRLRQGHAILCRLGQAYLARFQIV